MNQLRSYWIDLRASLWFVPSLIVLASMGAAVLLTETDGRVGMELATHWPRLFGASADADASRGIGIGSMLQFALDHDRIVRLAAATGAFVAAGSPVIELSGSDAPTQDDARRLRGWAAGPSLAPQRTVEQDAAFGLQQLVDVALKALCPASTTRPPPACASTGSARSWGGWPRGVFQTRTAWPGGGCG